MRLLPQRSYDAATLGLLEEAGGTVHRAALLLRDLVAEHPERGDLAGELHRCEHEGDRIAHDLIHRLDGRRSRLRLPFDTGDGHLLATSLDDIVDFAEEAADTMVLHHVEAPMQQAVDLAEVLVGATESVARALTCLGADADMGAHLVEIHRLENEGDRITRDAVASLFANGIDPMVVLRWKDIFDSLEASVDACEKVAHVLEGIALKRRR